MKKISNCNEMYLVLVFFYVKFHFPPLHTESDNKNKTIAKYAILCREILTRFIHPQLLENTRISVRLHFFLLTPILTYTFWVNFRSVVMIKIYKRQIYMNKNPLSWFFVLFTVSLSLFRDGDNGCRDSDSVWSGIFLAFDLRILLYSS